MIIIFEEFINTDGDMVIPETYTESSLPEGLIIPRDLIILSTALSIIPDDIKIKRSLIAKNSNL